MALAEMAQPGDLVVAMDGFGPLYQEFVLRRHLDVEFLALNPLIKEYPSNVRGCQDELRRRLHAVLKDGRRLLVLGIHGEELVPGRGYPWALIYHQGYTPDTFMSVLDEFHRQPLVESTARRPAIWRLCSKERNAN
jgi:hypothetical protein